MRRAGVALIVTVVAALVSTAAASGGSGAARVGSSAVTEGVPYGHPDDPFRTLEVWQPETVAEGAPALVLVHGGGWGGGRPDDLARQARLANRQGWTVFNVAYPTTQVLGFDGEAFPAEVDAVRQAITWVQDNAGAYGADPAHVAVLGASAGGHLVSLATAGGDTGAGAVALWSPPTELAGLVSVGGSPPTACNGNALCVEFWSAPWVTNFLGCAPDDCPERYAAASPAQQMTADAPPTYLANSTDEIVPATQAEALAAVLAEAGVEHQLTVLPGDDHAHAFTAEVWNPTMAFLAGALSVPAPEPIDFDEGSWPVDPVVLAGAAVVIALAGAGAIVARRSRHDSGSGG